MKNFIAITVILLFSFVSISCKKKAKDTEVARKGFVNFLAGDVKLISDKGVENAAKVGDEILQGMKIKTVGVKSFVDIYFGENVVKVLGNTVVGITRLITNMKTKGQETVFSLENGKLFSRVSKKLAKSDKFSVKTPTTTAGVRGTDFLVSEKEGKANVACLEGMLKVLNNSMPDAPVTVEADKEVDIEKDKAPMVKNLSDENKKMMSDIVKGISEMREDIRRKMEQQREEIKQYVIDQKEKDRTILQEQKDGDKARVEDQKQRDRENIDNIKGVTKDKADEAVNTAKDKMDAAKNVDTESTKPKIEKPKLNMDQFKLKK